MSGSSGAVMDLSAALVAATVAAALVLQHYQTANIWYPNPKHYSMLYVWIVGGSGGGGSGNFNSFLLRSEP